MLDYQWLIQSSGIQDDEFRRTCDALKELNYNFVDFGMVPFTECLTNLESITAENLIARSGTKFVKVATEGKITDIHDKPIDNTRFANAIDYNQQNFDQLYYNTLGLPLLNADTKIFKYSDVKDTEFYDSYFFKPTNDLKVFNACIVYEGQTLASVITSGMHQKFDEANETVLMTTLKHVKEEFRFFVVNQEVITGSRYYVDGELNKAPYEDIPKDIRDAADEYAKLYRPADIFVMDLCTIDDDIKIVEYNCWNASGFYMSDLNKLFEAVQTFKVNMWR